MKDFWLAYWTSETAHLRQTVAECDFVRRVNTPGELAIIGKYCILPYLAEGWAHCRSNNVMKDTAYCQQSSLLLPSEIPGKIHMWDTSRARHCWVLWWNWSALLCSVLLTSDLPLLSWLTWNYQVLPCHNNSFVHSHRWIYYHLGELIIFLFKISLGGTFLNGIIFV